MKVSKITTAAFLAGVTTLAVSLPAIGSSNDAGPTLGVLPSTLSMPIANYSSRDSDADLIDIMALDGTLD